MDRPAAPLATHGSPAPEPRDPTRAFQVASGALTDHSTRHVSAWGSAHADSEYSQVNRPVPAGTWPPPTTAPAAAPPGPAAAPPAGPPIGTRRGVTLGAVLSAAHPGAVISLVIGGIGFAVGWIPILGLVAAALFGTRVRQARQAVQPLLVGPAAIACGWFLMTALLNGLQVGPALRSTGFVCAALCWIALIGLLATVTRSLSRGEPPTATT